MMSRHASGIFIAQSQVFGSVAQYENALLVAKLKAARDRIKAQDKKWEEHPGYQDEGNSGVLKEISRLRRKRKGMSRRTYPDIVRILNETGWKTITGRPFNKGNVARIVQKHKRGRLMDKQERR